MKTVRRQTGFTIMELLIVISIMMILIGIATVSLSEYRERTEIQEAARTLEGFFYDARTAARTRQRTVLIDFTSTGSVAYIDRNLSGPPYAAAEDELITAHRISSRLELLGESEPLGFVIPGNMGFSGSGRLDTTDIRRIFVLRNPSNPARQYRVNVYQTGGTRVEKSGDSGATWNRAW